MLRAQRDQRGFIGRKLDGREARRGGQRTERGDRDLRQQPAYRKNDARSQTWLPLEMNRVGTR